MKPEVINILWRNPYCESKIKLNSARDGLAPTPEAECLKCLIRNFFDGLVKLYHLANDTKKQSSVI